MTEQEKKAEFEKNMAAYKARYEAELERKKAVSTKALHDKARRLKHHKASNWTPV